MEIELGGVAYTSAPDTTGVCTGCAFQYNLEGCTELCADYDCVEHDIIWVKAHEVAEKPSTTKDSNPKDAVGVTKAPLSTIPTQVLHEIGLAMLEGALKYGKFNYRVAGVRYSVYYDAVQRHLNAFNEGQDDDPDSDVSHITKAIAGLIVLRDGMLNDKWEDDRPPKPLNPNWMQELDDKVKALLVKYPDPVPAYTQKGTK